MRVAEEAHPLVTTRFVGEDDGVLFVPVYANWPGGFVRIFDPPARPVDHDVPAKRHGPDLTSLLPTRCRSFDYNCKHRNRSEYKGTGLGPDVIQCASARASRRRLRKALTHCAASCSSMVRAGTRSMITTVANRIP